MNSGTIDDFYRAAFGRDTTPFDYQRRLAYGKRFRGGPSCRE